MEAASLGGIIFGFLAGLRFNPAAISLLKPSLPSLDATILQVVSFAIVFAVVFILCNLIGWLIRFILKKTSLSWTEKGLGAGLAILKGILITYLAIVILTFFVPSKAPLVAGSKLAPLIISSYQSIVRIMSPDFYQQWARRFKGHTDKIGNVVSKKIEDVLD
jgi:membrane protein required for colicin V production